MLVVREPGISWGRFSVLTRTDGTHIVYDPARPLGRRTVSMHKTIEEATRACRLAATKAAARGEP